MSLDYIDPTTPPPVEWSGAIFPEPMLYRLAPLWLFLLVLAVLGLLFYRQRLLDSRSDGRRAPAIIYQEVRKAINQALYATGPATIPAGQKVIETLKLYLGPILSFSAEFHAPYAKLEKAVRGEAEKSDHGSAHHPAADHAPQPAVVVASGAENKVVVTPAQILISQEAGHGGHDHGGHGPHGERLEAMSTNEQTAAVRYALERLHEFWTANTVEPKLWAIHEAVSIREPKGVRLSREAPRSRDAARRPATDARRGPSSLAAKPRT